MGDNMTRPTKTAVRTFRSIGTLAIVLGTAAAADPPRELRVCADPNNFPFSNERLEGFENKIAEVIANDMNASVRYTWHPQRRGFIRETLKAGLCDLVIGVPTGYDLVLTTKPYYRSTYVFVYPKNKNLDLRSFDDPVLRTINIGVHAFGEDGANSPPVHALARRGIVRNVVGFTLFATDDSPPGKIIDDVAAGKIDVAIVWGPFAGYFAKKQPIELAVWPVSPSTDRGTLPFTYEVSMGVRRDDNAFKEQVEGILNRRPGEIRKILEDYGAPLVDSATISSTTDTVQSGNQSSQKGGKHAN